jgi:hypothetical protein
MSAAAFTVRLRSTRLLSFSQHAMAARRPSWAMTNYASTVAGISFSTRRQARVPVRSERHAKLLSRPLRYTREQHRELGLTTRIRLGQDRFETLPDGFDAEPLIIGSFVKIAPAGKADCDSCFHRRKTEPFPQDVFRSKNSHARSPKRRSICAGCVGRAITSCPMH